MSKTWWMFRWSSGIFLDLRDFLKPGENLMKFRNLGEHGNNFERSVLLFWVLVKNAWCNLDQNGLVKTRLCPPYPTAKQLNNGLPSKHGDYHSQLAVLPVNIFHFLNCSQGSGSRSNFPRAKSAKNGWSEWGFQEGWDDQWSMINHSYKPYRSWIFTKNTLTMKTISDVKKYYYHDYWILLAILTIIYWPLIIGYLPMINPSLMDIHH